MAEQFTDRDEVQTSAGHIDAAAEDFWPQVVAARQAGYGNTWDVWIRCIFVATAGALLWWAQQDLIFLEWSALYVLWNWVLWRYISRITRPVPRRTYYKQTAVYAGNSLIYAAMPVYLWFTVDSAVLKFVAGAGIFSHALFALAYHNNRSLISLLEQSWILGSVALIGIFQIVQAETLAERALIGLGVIGPMTYFMIAQFNMMRDREALRLSRENELRAEKMAIISRTTSKIAHDFNNILTAVQGNMEIAEITHDPQERRAVLKEARSATKQAAGLIAQMMVYVRKSPIDARDTNVLPYLDALEGQFRQSLPENITVRITPPEQDVVFHTDEALLDTALLNLLLNARDAIGMRDGWVHLRVSLNDGNRWAAELPPAQGPFILFQLEDSGPGIPAHLIGQVSEPFVTTKHPGTGSGLGLSMVSGFAAQSGGHLHLENAAPRGGLIASLVLPVSNLPQKV